MLNAFSSPASAPRSAMLPASRWTPSSRAQARAAPRLGPSSGSACGGHLLARGEVVPLLRQGDQLGAARRGAHEALGGGEVPRLVPIGVELHRRYAHFESSLGAAD